MLSYLKNQFLFLKNLKTLYAYNFLVTMPDTKIQKVIVPGPQRPFHPIREMIKYTNDPQYTKEWAEVDAGVRTWHGKTQVHGSDWDPQTYREVSGHGWGKHAHEDLGKDQPWFLPGLQTVPHKHQWVLTCTPLPPCASAVRWLLGPWHSLCVPS